MLKISICDGRCVDPLTCQETPRERHQLYAERGGRSDTRGVSGLVGEDLDFAKE